MDKVCGNCGHCRNTHDGPYCYKGGTPKPVSPIRTMDCWTDPAEVQQPPVMTKVCSHCGCELPVSNFGRHSRTKDGYQPGCRECQRQMNKGHKKRGPFEHNEKPEKPEEFTPEQMGIGKGRRATHPTYVDKYTGVTMKWCKCCGQYKPIDEFHHNKANKDGHEFDCKVCHNARVSAQHRKKAEQRKVEKELAELAKRAETEIPYTSSEPEIVNDLADPIPPVPTLYSATDDQLVEELKRRGYTGNIIRKISFIL